MTAHPPLVAVVTPILPGADGLPTTLAAVAAQTHPAVVHLILDADGSAATAAALGKAAEGARPPTVVRFEGPAEETAVWNAAIGLVPSDAVYVKWLLPGAGMTPDALAALVAVAESDLAIDYLSARDVVDGVAMETRLPPGRSVMEGRAFARLALLGFAHWHAWHHMVFRATPERLAAPFEMARRPALDTHFVFRHLIGRKVAVLEAPLFTSPGRTAPPAPLDGEPAVAEVANFELMILHGRTAMRAEEFAFHFRDGQRWMSRLMLGWRKSDPARYRSADRRLRSHGIGPVTHGRALAGWLADGVVRKVRRTLGLKLAGPPPGED